MISSANKLYLRRCLRWRTLRLVLVLFCLVNVLDVLRVHGNLSRGEGGRDTRGPSRPHERVYIASMHFNNGDVLRHHWNDAVIRLTEVLGPANVFVSIFESGSWDDSKEVLGHLELALRRQGVPHRVEMSNLTHHDEINREEKGEGWIDTPRNKKELRRIPYLARLRNRTIKDLVDLHEKGVTFDKVLFLNDVIFTTGDVLTLMDTNKGEYAAACSLDFSKPPLYYDTFALRDTAGRGHVMQTWPYFGERQSRNALVNHMDAVPVMSCWNGIVVMPAEPFVSSTRLRFRGVPDSLALHHVEGSECCLIHADNPLSRTLGVYLNPRVRVGYNLPAYKATHRGGGAWVSAWDVFAGLWANRVRRWTARLTLERIVVRRRVERWERERAVNYEPGVFCLVNEMQVLADNGWAHV
ncbi:cryptococcal mannosyltransferase 1 domain-containing protein [Hirsutella rhossiliensis]|uniref:Cryptococcal mannosyltransferase 1 domain-containing protein n=1 Tax=Hirsutella rhossiliensis TaxID=111463 RepID=A0A9P8N566_9HYPO|nr:cryptococcal mannosyltransferase 1 domain-containing protein [Hirsutella rhossiliensis]KAH0967172.1 cryptococcal mannosyltransferase 1 domain-containing protein [Hirsutella rhossiliensis]